MQKVGPHAEAWPLDADVVICVPFSMLDIEIKCFSAIVGRICVSPVAWSRHIHVRIQDRHPVLTVCMQLGEELRAFIDGIRIVVVSEDAILKQVIQVVPDSFELNIRSRIPIDNFL
jgi:hypothetical protein